MGTGQLYSVRQVRTFFYQEMTSLTFESRGTPRMLVFELYRVQHLLEFDAWRDLTVCLKVEEGYSRRTPSRPYFHPLGDFRCLPSGTKSLYRIFHNFCQLPV